MTEGMREGGAATRLADASKVIDSLQRAVDAKALEAGAKVRLTLLYPEIPVDA